MQLRVTQAWQLVSAFLIVAVMIPAGDCLGAVTVVYEKERLTVRAIDSPLENILQALSTELDMDIYVADECRRQLVTVDLASEPVEAALGRILRLVSYAAMYQGSGAGARIARLSVFPKGKADSPMTLVKRGDAAGIGVRQQNATEAQAPQASPGVSGALFPVGGLMPALEDTGVLVPQSPELSGKITLASVAAMEGMERERALHEEIRELELKAASAGDDNAREALSVALRDKIEEFYQLQKSNRNMQAALRRIELFEQQNAADADR